VGTYFATVDGHAGSGYISREFAHRIQGEKGMEASSFALTTLINALIIVALIVFFGNKF
jgi:hypothetical protein